ncbi:FAD-dependent monooxygenase [Nocardia gipuzkoensis]|uniref:FAD-dependent monooxygenase n=1 Tax=Nocardia gipuzkoensis TaxID=2749991 RepID=UPI0015EE61BA|nr:FAD-dependent monooxygenase [Nocardia gipuzkoensis]
MPRNTQTPTRGPRPEHGASEHFPVLVVGAGPVGLTLALELEYHGVRTLLIERNATGTRHPKMDITNGRSMELYRRLGVAQDLRKVAVPAENPTVVSWVTEIGGPELTRFTYPGVTDRAAQIRACTDGTLPLEPAMRVSQVVLEPTLKELIDSRAERVELRFGWALDSFSQDANGVTATIRSSATGELRTITADYLAGCDGAASVVRESLGIELEMLDLRREIVREVGVRRMGWSVLHSLLTRHEKPVDGRFFMVHFTSEDKELFQRTGPVWHIQSPDGWTVISQNDDGVLTMHAPLRVGQDPETIDPREFLFENLGRRFECEILLANMWTPRVALAHRYGHGRVWLAGDAVHQVPPTGGYGMNTGVGDAVGLGWSLAAMVNGWGGPALLQAYEIERRAVARRNRAAAVRHSAVRIAIKTFYPGPARRDRWNGDLRRHELGRAITDLGNLENEALGIEMGYRYSDSPIVCAETGAQPPQRIESYTPTTWPGSRPPAVHLADGAAIFDLFGRDFTLLRFTDTDVTALVEAAARHHVPLEVVDIRDETAHRLYERDLVLIRPDQHVAWRANTVPVTPSRVIETVSGLGGALVDQK